MDFRLRFDLRSEEEVEEGSGGEEVVRFRGDLRSCGGCGCGIVGLGREESSERRALVRLRGDRRTIFIFKLPFSPPDDRRWGRIKGSGSLWAFSSSMVKVVDVDVEMHWKLERVVGRVGIW